MKPCHPVGLLTFMTLVCGTDPEQIEMFPTPDRLQYDDGQLLSMRCTGRIGNQFDENNLQNLFKWEWRSVNSEFASWTRYPNYQNIPYEPPTSSGDCQYTGASTLVHTVSNLDNGRQFRCSVIIADYSANKTVYLVGTGARLTTSQTPITIGGSSPSSQLTVSCRPDAPGITQVFSMEIGKKSSNGSNQPIIRMGNTDTSVQVVDTSLQQWMTASGSISGAAGIIQFILTNLRCAGAASTYYCRTLYLTDSVGSAEATANITARTYPEQVEMLPAPDRAHYNNGEVITIRCSGRIGNQFDENNLQNLFKWESRPTENEHAPWTRYPNDRSITYERPTSSGGCQYTGASTLVHTVSITDNGRQFRCSVINADYSDSKTVYVVVTTTSTSCRAAISHPMILILWISIIPVTNSMFLGDY